MDEQWPVTKSIDGCFHLLVACSQSLFTAVWTSDSGDANLSLFQSSSGELGSAIASIFDGMCGEFTFS